MGNPAARIARDRSPTAFLPAPPLPEKPALDEIGVEGFEDLKELDDDDVARLSSTLKKIQAKKFVQKLESL